MDLIHVTEVLSLFYKNPHSYSGSLAEELYFARGSAVHIWCGNYANRIWSPIPKEYEGYINSFKNWFDKYVYQVLFVEIPFEDPDLGFTGQPDLGCILGEEKDGILIDFKTSQTSQKVWQAQLAAYLHLVQKAGLPITRAGVLKLDSEGKEAKFVPCEVPDEAFSAFLSALNAYRYFLNKN